MEMDIYAVGEHELSTSLTNWLIPLAEQMESDSVALDCEFIFSFGCRLLLVVLVENPIVNI